MGLPKWSESYVQDLEADCRRGSGPRMERRQGGESLAMMGRVFQEDFQSLCDLPAVRQCGRRSWCPGVIESLMSGCTLEPLGDKVPAGA